VCEVGEMERMGKHREKERDDKRSRKRERLRVQEDCLVSARGKRTNFKEV